MYKLLFFTTLFVGTTIITKAQTAQPAASTAKDSTTGVLIQYDITRKVDGQNIRIVVIEDGEGGGQESPNVPSTITLQQSVGVSTTGADLTEPQMPMPKMMDNDGAVEERIIVRPVKEAFSMDFAKRTMSRVMTSEHDTEHKTYTNTVSLETPKDWKSDKKTKKIANYECKRAKCTVGEEEFTVWYTTDLPGTFSPLPNVFPPTAGVVLAIESDEQAYEATFVKKDTQVALPASIPADAVVLTPDEMKAKRNEFVKKAMSEGGSFQIRRN